MGQAPANIVVNSRTDIPDYLYTTNENDNTVSFVRLDNQTQDQAVQVGSHPWGIGLTPLKGGRQFIFTANYGDKTYSFIEVQRRQTTTRTISGVTGNFEPRGVVCSPKDQTAYIISDVPASGSTGCQILKINADQSQGGLLTIPGSVRLWKGAITNDGTELYLTDQGSAALYKVNLGTFANDGQIQLDNPGYGIALLPPQSGPEQVAYVSVPNGTGSGTNLNGVVDVVSLTGTGQTVHRPAVTHDNITAYRPQAIACNAAGTECWVALQNSLGYFSLDQINHPDGTPAANLAIVPYTNNPGQSPPIGDIALGAGTQ